MGRMRDLQASLHSEVGRGEKGKGRGERGGKDEGGMGRRERGKGDEWDGTGWE